MNPKSRTGLLLPCVGLPLALLALPAMADGSPLNAQDQDIAKSAQTENPPWAGQGLGLSNFSVMPQFGAINFKGNSRMATGAQFGIFFYKSDLANIGLSAAGIFSGLNNGINGTSGFSSGISSQNRTYIVQVPTEIYFRLLPHRFEKWDFGPHVGVNTIYSSSGVGNNWGSNDTAFITPGTGQGVRWNTHFTVGPSLTYHVSNTFDVGLTFSNTFMQAFNMRTLLLGVGIVV